MAVSFDEYERIALADGNVAWELWDGRLRGKPGMSVGHNRSINGLGYQLQRQLEGQPYEVRTDLSRVRRSERAYAVPDVFVVPVEFVEAIPGRPDVLEAFAAPLPLVVEVWSTSTGVYDVNSKLPEYKRRGDLEIRRLHPYERTLTIGRRQADGSYTESVVTGGLVEPVALLGVTIELDALFA